MGRAVTTKHAESGFTLLEVMVAIALIIFGLLALLVVLPATMTVTRNARESQIAISAIRSQIDEMRASPWYDPDNPGDPNVFNMYNNATFTAVGLSNASGRVTFLSEFEAATAFGVRVDLDSDSEYNETATAVPEFQCYPTRLSLRWTDYGNQVRGATVTTIIYNHSK